MKKDKSRKQSCGSHIAWNQPSTVGLQRRLRCHIVVK